MKKAIVIIISFLILGTGIFFGINFFINNSTTEKSLTVDTRPEASKTFSILDNKTIQKTSDFFKDLGTIFSPILGFLGTLGGAIMVWINIFKKKDKEEQPKKPRTKRKITN